MESGRKKALSFREFIVKNYQTIKAKNTTLPILVRESAGIEAIAYYRFG
jgi:Mitochondrial ribosomal protein L51 / S25 / CI-B8 domain